MAGCSRSPAASCRSPSARSIADRRGCGPSSRRGPRTFASGSPLWMGGPRGSDRRGGPRRGGAGQRPRRPLSRGRASRRGARHRASRLRSRLPDPSLRALAGVPLRRALARRDARRMKEFTPADASLLELVDRLLHKGVVLAGEATISVAGVDLIYLGLNVVLAAVETLERAERRAS